MLTVTVDERTKTCLVCGEGFTRNRKYGHAQWARAAYCSSECLAASKRLDRPPCACGCGEPVTRPSFRFRAGHNTRTDEWKEAARRRPVLRGPDNPNWKHGRTRHHHTPEHQAWREAIYARDGYACQDCGRVRRPGDRVILEAHHIKPYAEFPELAFDLDNGITLCRECHRQGRHGVGRRGEWTGVGC